MKTIPSPYAFQPLNANVHTPKWQNVSQDFPLKNQLSGTLNIRLKNHSPLAIGTEFFTTPDGKPAIPGTTIKGLLRSMIEGSTLGRLEQINNDHFSFRDLVNKEYTSEMVNKSLAGWLSFDGKQWTLKHADLYRIKNTEIENVFSIKITTKHRDPESIYNALGGLKTIYMNATEFELGNNNEKIIHSIAKEKSEAKPHSAHLIVSGQVSNNKKKNFIFSAPKDNVDFADSSVIDTFLKIITKKDPQKKQDIWTYMQDQKHPHGIPVFYTQNNAGQAKAIGMSQMFRLPYLHEVAALKPEAHKEAYSKHNEKDFASLLFGEINETRNSTKGRVSCGLMSCEQSLPKFNSPVSLILGSPKATFYPAYLNGKTYNQQDALLAGRKHYLIQKSHQTPVVPEEQKNVATTLTALKENHSFIGKLRFHNINSVELGALIWALTLGEQTHENSPYYHNLGMAKPLGFGKIQFEMLALHTNNPDIDISSVLNDFYAYYYKNLDMQFTQLKQLRHLHKERSESLSYPKELKDFDTLKKNKATLPTQAFNEETQWADTLRVELADTIAQLEEDMKKEAALEQQKREAEKQAEEAKQKEAEREAKLANRNAFEVLWEDTMDKTISKQTLNLLIETPSLYQSLSDEEKEQLKNKIEIDPWFKGLKDKRKKWRQKLPDLLK